MASAAEAPQIATTARHDAERRPQPEQPRQSPRLARIVVATLTTTISTGPGPSPAICSIVIRTPSSATPSRSTLRAANSIPATQRPSSCRKWNAMPSSSANSIGGHSASTARPRRCRWSVPPAARDRPHAPARPRAAGATAPAPAISRPARSLPCCRARRAHRASSAVRPRRSADGEHCRAFSSSSSFIARLFPCPGRRSGPCRRQAPIPHPSSNPAAPWQRQNRRAPPRRHPVFPQPRHGRRRWAHKHPHYRHCRTLSRPSKAGV